MAHRRRVNARHAKAFGATGAADGAYRHHAIPHAVLDQLQNAVVADILAFCNALPNSDKHLSMLKSSAHIAPLGVNRHRFYHLLNGFLRLPSDD